MHALARFFLFAILFFSISASAQVCSGTLGDPVVGAGTDFGRGTSAVGQAISNTTYNYVSNPGGQRPDDGEYTIVKTTQGLNQGWHQNVNNHTPNDPNGYMMVINANATRGKFYEATVNNLCPNTTYEFAAYVINILRNTGIKPNIKFSIENNGAVIKEFSTGDIPEGSASNWIKYGTIFTTPVNVGVITLKMTNENPGGVGNDLAIDDITFRACGPTITSSINNGANTFSICEGTSGTYRLSTVVSSGYTDPVYQWQENNGSGWININGQTSMQTIVNLSNAVKGTYQYRLLVAERQNINSANCRIASDPMSIIVNPIPVPIASNTGPVCYGSDIQLNVSEGTTFSWTGPNGFTSQEKSPFIRNVSANSAGTYRVTATTNGCSNVAETIVEAREPIESRINISQTPLCENESIQLEAFGGTTYSWSPVDGLSNANIANPVATPKVTTKYTVTISNGACSTTQEVLINVFKKPVANAGPDKKILTGQSVVVEGKVSGTENDFGFYWTPVDYLDDPTKINPVANPPKDIIYTLHTTSILGCEGTSDQVSVTVYPKIEIPNTFSPNGDGINDTWTIEAAEAFPEPKIKIVNRSGQTVFQSKGIYKPWDGKVEGKDLPTAVYYYTIYFNSDFNVYSGWLLLTR